MYRALSSVCFLNYHAVLCVLSVESGKPPISGDVLAFPESRKCLNLLPLHESITYSSALCAVSCS